MIMFPHFNFFIVREEKKFQNKLFIKLMLWLMDKEIKEVISKHTEESDRLIGSSISANRAINIFYKLIYTSTDS
jgi:hypothetical protein